MCRNTKNLFENSVLNTFKLSGSLLFDTSLLFGRNCSVRKNIYLILLLLNSIAVKTHRCNE